MIGQVLAGKYEVLRQLGAGAMGEVYEAKNVATLRRVAVKVIRSEIASMDMVVQRFQREARAAGAIESRHIAQVLDAGRDDASGCPFLVMEFLSGEDVDALVKELGPLRPTLALRVVAQALAGLQQAHGANVIHRDIKPANLFLARVDGGQRVVKLVDFGIAKVKDDLVASRDVALTQTSSILGSPLYMSPEQAKESKKVDARADIWSLGCVLYQLLCGAAPNAHLQSLTELLVAICTEPPRPIQSVAPWVPPEIAAIVSRALTMDVNGRWQTAAEMLAAIAQLVPDWAVLNDGMLTPMSDDERAFVATPAHAASQPGATTGPGSSSASSAGAVGAVSSNGEMASSRTMRELGGTAHPGIGRKGAALLVAAALAVLGTIGTIGFVSLRNGGDAANADAASGIVGTAAAPEAPSALPAAAETAPAAIAAPVMPAQSAAEAPARTSSPGAASPPVAKTKPAAAAGSSLSTDKTAVPHAAPAKSKPAASATATSTSSPISREFN